MEQNNLQSPCCNADVRAEVDQTCKITIDKNGFIKDCWDFSEPEVNRDYIYCENCGQELFIDHIGNNNYRLIVKQ